MRYYVLLEHKVEETGANCQWCGDLGEFEDEEGQTWPCVEGCKPKVIETTAQA